MKIAIDISPIIYGTGVSVYTKQLVKNLLRIDKTNQYILFGGSLRRRREFEDFYKSLSAKNAKLITSFLSPTMVDILWNRLHLVPIEAFVGKVDVYHSSDWAQAPSKAFKVTTVHDLAPFVYPDHTPSKIVQVHTRRMKRVKKEVDKIIVPSKSTASDLEKLFKINKNKINVISEGIDEIYKNNSTNKKKPYLLTVGAGYRKNTDKLIEAFKTSGYKGQLIIVGNYSTTERNVITTGRVSDEELVALYAGAEVMVYPSLYEGFGLPILQSMAMGVPVVTSNISSMPEVAGDSAVLVDPQSVQSIANGINKALKIKKELIKKGKQRVKQFSWEQTAQETLKIYVNRN